MNKTVNINLAGIFFHIDEDAYLKLSRYLDAIKRSFTDSQGRSEIIADIESRIAELFAERIQNEKQVVGVKLVDEVITIMGQPEDYLVDDEIFEDEPQAKQSQSSRPSKKLYRDTDNSYIGGVAAGLSHYFSVDSIWIRLIWLLFALGSGGTFIVIYLIFWALVPEAKTTAEKLTMTGDAVNISNIEKKIKDGISSVSENLKEGFDNVSDNVSETVKRVDFQRQGNRLKSSSQTFFDTLGGIIMFFLKVIAKFIGIILMVVGLGTLITLIIALFTVGITDAIQVPGMDFLDVANAANIPIWLMSVLLFLAVGIPFFFVFYLGLKILVNNLKSIGNIAKFTLLGLWLIAIIGLIITGIKQATEHALDGKSASKQELYIGQQDTLKLSMVGFDRYSVYSYGNNGNFNIIEDADGRSIVSSDIRLSLRSTKDSIASIVIEKEATGSNYTLAGERAENIVYNYDFTDKHLKLDAYFTTDVANKFSEQKVRITLYLPEGMVLYPDKNVDKFKRNSKGRDNLLYVIWAYNHHVKILEDFTECLDCPELNEAQNSNESVEEITPSDKDKPEVSIKINDEDGVNIEVNDN